MRVPLLSGAPAVMAESVKFKGIPCDTRRCDHFEEKLKI